jgi:hypothetical protein
MMCSIPQVCAKNMLCRTEMYVFEALRCSISCRFSILQISMSFIPLPSTDSFQCPTTDSPPSYMIHSEEHEEVIRKFLRSCMPNLEHLLPVFIRIGLEERRDLEGALNWPAKERVSWLMELSKEEWGISRMNVKSLSLAFDVTEQYEATLVAMGADK